MSRKHDFEVRECMIAHKNRKYLCMTLITVKGGLGEDGGRDVRMNQIHNGKPNASYVREV